MKNLCKKSGGQELQSQTVEWLRFALAVLVIALHCSFTADIRYDTSLSQFLRVVICVVGNVAVPTFFMVSGYFFFSGLQEWDWNKWGMKLKKRVRTLFLPYVLWCLIAILLGYLWSYAHHPITFLEFWENNDGWRSFYDAHRETSTNFLGYTINEGKPINGPLWYLRDLIFLCLFSPIIYIAIKKIGVFFVSLLAVLFLLNLGLPFAGFSIRGLFFFSVGAYFMINQSQFIDFFNKIKIPAYIISTCLFPLCVFMYNGGHWAEYYLWRIFVLSSVVSICCLSYSLMAAGKIKVHPSLSKSSFFIYALHTIVVLDLSNFILWRLMPFDCEFVQVLKVFLRPIFATGICLGLFFFMRRFMPRTLSLLTGDRK